MQLLTNRAPRKPRAEPESEPEGESTGNQGHAYTEPNAERTLNSTAISEPTAENWPEPGPRWNLAYKTWEWAWELHVYLYATIFLTIGLYANYYVIANVYDGLQGKYLSVSLNILVAFFGYSRAFVMFLDPYHQGSIIHKTVVMRVIWSLSGPCLTASDCMMILALIETAKISIAPPKLQKAWVNVAIICFHFALVITTDCVVSDYVEAKAMLLFCQLFFATWGSVLGTVNFILGYKLDTKLFSHKKPKEKEDKIYIYLIYASGAANYFLCGIVIYSAFGVFGVYSDVEYVDAWPWWTFQTLSRFSEILACVLIFTVSAKRTRVKRAVAMVTDNKDFDSMEARTSSKSKSRRWADCFKRKRASSTDMGSVVSLYTALRGIAFGPFQHVGPVPHSIPRISRECWSETTTTSTRTLILGTPDYTSTDQKVGDKPKEADHPGLEILDVRRESMFTALHEQKRKISLQRKYSADDALSEDIESEKDTKCHSKNRNKSQRKISTCKVSPL